MNFFTSQYIETFKTDRRKQKKCRDNKPEILSHFAGTWISLKLSLVHKDCRKGHQWQLQSRHHHLDQSCSPEKHLVLVAIVL